jgi:hypothetical protein
MSFFFYKVRQQESVTDPLWGLVPEGVGRMYVNGKIRPAETAPGVGEGIRENDGGGEFKWDIFDTL